MEVKTEYTVFTCERHISTTYYYDFNFDTKSNKYKKLGGFGYIPYFHKFDTLMDADAYLAKLKEAKACHPVRVYVVNNTRELDIYKATINAMWDKKNEYKEVAFVCRVPDEFYLGAKWRETLEYMGDTRYSDDKPCQIHGHADADILAKDKWLVYNSPTDFHWVEDRFEASFFAKNEAEQVQKIVNNIRAKEIPYKGYVHVDSLPLRIEDEQPKFQKGDKVFILGYDRIPNFLRYPCYEGEITDIMVGIGENDGKKQFLYAFDNSPYCDKFLEAQYFCTEEELISKGGNFHRGMRSGYPNTKLLSYNNREYVVY